MKRYRDMHAECEGWYKNVKMWDNIINSLREMPACDVGDERTVVHQIKQTRTSFDEHYREIFWARNTNPRPSGRKRLS